MTSNPPEPKPASARPRGAVTFLGYAIGLAYGAVALWFFGGFLTHRSGDPLLFGWSATYAAALVVLAVLLVSPIPIARLAYRAGARTVVLSVIPTAVFLGVVWVAGATWFYGSREHDFDPFLQYPPASIVSDDARRGEGPLRVLAIGGSTTGNERLPEEVRYPKLLEDRLQELYPGAEVLNAGADWWTTQHSLINYVTHVRRWQPDVVVIMHAINDLYRSFSPPQLTTGPYDPRYAHFYGPAIVGARPRTFSDYIGTRLSGIRHTISGYWYGGRNDWSFQRFDEVDYPLERYHALTEFDFYLRTLVELVREDGAEVVLLTQASIYKPEMSDAERGILVFTSLFCRTEVGARHYEIPSVASIGSAMDEFNRRTGVIASGTGSTLIDVAGAMPKTLEYFTDDVHFTAEGAQLIADMVGEAIEAMPLRARSAQPSPDPAN